MCQSALSTRLSTASPTTRHADADGTSQHRQEPVPRATAERAATNCTPRDTTALSIKPHLHTKRLGSTTGKSRSTCMEPTRNGAHTNQSTDHPRAAYTKRGPHQSRQGLSTCRLHATRFTQVKSGVTHVSARYVVHASRSTD